MSDFNATLDHSCTRCKKPDGRRLIEIVTISLVLVFGLAVSISNLPGAYAQGGTLVRCQPATISSSNDTVDVDLYVQNVTDLYGADLRLSFDTTKAQVVDADSGTSGVQIRPLNSFLSPDSPVKKEADNAAGTIWYALTQLRPRPPATGSGLLARITFRRVAYGTFTLHFTKQELGQRDGILLPASTQDCSITFSGPATTVQFSSATYSVRENVGVATISVTLNAPSSQIVKVTYATSNGTATAGRDYVGSCGTLTFSPGQTLRTFSVPILADTVYEPDETVILRLSNPVNATLGAPNPATLIIQADVLHHIVLSPKTASITAGQSQAYTVKGFDAAGNSLGDLTAKASFAISSGAGGSWAGNVYTSEKAGTWTVTASVAGVSDTATLTVNPAGPYTLSLLAYPTSLPVGSTSALTATVRDRFGNWVSNGTVVTFTTDLGKVLSPRTTTNGVATSAISSTVAGTAHITAKSGPAQGTATVVFTPIIPTCVTIQRGALGQVIDAYIWSSQPCESFNNSKLYTGRYGCGERRTLARFRLEVLALPKGAVIQSATLGFKLNRTGSKQTVRVYRVTKTWSEGQPTWKNFAGNYDSTVVWGSFVPQGTGSVTTDVTGLVSSWVKGSVVNYGMMLTSSPNCAYDEYNSSETSQVDLRPWLKVCYTVP